MRRSCILCIFYCYSEVYSLILYSNFKHNFQRISVRNKKSIKGSNLYGTTNARNLNINPIRIKNNQFGVKWYLNRLLKAYYKTSNLKDLYLIENRLDLILFRSNWFKTNEAVKMAIKNKQIKVNNTIVTSNIMIKPGDIISMRSTNESNLPSSFKEVDLMTLSDWEKTVYLNLIQNVNYLEINNNIKTIIMLNQPQYNNLPFPFNLHKFYL